MPPPSISTTETGTVTELVVELSSDRYISLSINSIRPAGGAFAGAEQGSTGMEWKVVDAGNGITLVELSGRMDVAGALLVDPAFAEVARDNTSVIVDLAKVDFLASLGIRTLVSACKTLRAKNGGMVLLTPQPNVEQVLRSSGIDTIIPIVMTREEAEAGVLA